MKPDYIPPTFEEVLEEVQHKLRNLYGLSCDARQTAEHLQNYVANAEAMQKHIYEAMNAVDTAVRVLDSQKPGRVDTRNSYARGFLSPPPPRPSRASLELTLTNEPKETV